MTFLFLMLIKVSLFTRLHLYMYTCAALLYICATTRPTSQTQTLKMCTPSHPHTRGKPCDFPRVQQGNPANVTIYHWRHGQRAVLSANCSNANQLLTGNAVRTAFAVCNQFHARGLAAQSQHNAGQHVHGNSGQSDPAVVVFVSVGKQYCKHAANYGQPPSNLGHGLSQFAGQGSLLEHARQRRSVRKHIPGRSSDSSLECKCNNTLCLGPDELHQG